MKPRCRNQTFLPKKSEAMTMGSMLKQINELDYEFTNTVLSDD